MVATRLVLALGTFGTLAHGLKLVLDPMVESGVELSAEVEDVDEVVEVVKTRLKKRGKARPRNVADLWKKCVSPVKDMYKGVAVVSSQKHKFLYVDNVKAGSTSIRSVLKGSLNASWFWTDVATPRQHVDGLRTNSVEFSDENIAELMKFSFVRDPVAKFESGVRQAYCCSGIDYMKNLTADEMLARQIAEGPSHWLNEHFMTSSWRLSPYTKNHSRIDFDFIGQLENIEDGWNFVVDKMEALIPAQSKKLRKIRGHNTRQGDNGGRSRLSDAGIRMMCESELYGHEWECFGYPKPAVCK